MHGDERDQRAALGLAGAWQGSGKLYRALAAAGRPWVWESSWVLARTGLLRGTKGVWGYLEVAGSGCRCPSRPLPVLQMPGSRGTPAPTSLRPQITLTQRPYPTHDSLGQGCGADGCPHHMPSSRRSSDPKDTAARLGINLPPPAPFLPQSSLQAPKASLEV